FRVYNFLLNNAYKKINQSTITTACHCTPEYTCKIIKKLKNKGVIIKNSRNSLFVNNPLILSFLLSFEQKTPTPVMYKTPGYEDAISVLNDTIYSLTLDSAEKIKQNKKPKIIQAYVLGKDLQTLDNKFTRTTRDANLVVYQADHFRFLNQQMVNNTFLATDYEIFTDLLRASKTGKAFKFAKDFKLFKGI
ncbi:MAG: hypothetical protein JW791_03645, partial [Nanoarchaeota archaeon]|nr:hypothetical protein [Nanoarchaeota archaeon]